MAQSTPSLALAAFRKTLETISGMKNYHDKADAKRWAAEALAAHPESAEHVVFTVAEGTEVVIGWRGIVIPLDSPEKPVMTRYVYTDREAARRAAEIISADGPGAEPRIGLGQGVQS